MERTRINSEGLEKYPSEAKLIPRIGSHQKLNLEAIIALRPDLALAWHSGNPTSELSRIDRLCIPIFLSEPGRLEHIADTLHRLGRLTGVEDHADHLAKTFLADALMLKNQYNSPPPVRIPIRMIPLPVNRPIIVPKSVLLSLFAIIIFLIMFED